MKISATSLLFAFALTNVFSFVGNASAEETAKDVVEHVKAGVKKGARAIKDEACPLVDGKVQCAAKKVKHKAENAADEVKK